MRIQTSLFLIITILAAACQRNEVKKDPGVKIALIIPTTRDDKGWSQSMYDTISAVSEANPGQLHLNVSENMFSPDDAEEKARKYIAEEYDYYIFHGNQYTPAVKTLSEEFPEKIFVFGTTSDSYGPNVLTYQILAEETAYISGMIAGLITQTGKIGIVAPVESGGAEQFNKGFWLGLRSVNRDAEFGILYTDSYGNFTKAGDLAKGFIKEGYDILAGSSQQGLGALQAVAQFPNRDVYWMGTSDHHFDDPAGYKLIAASSYNFTPIVDRILRAEDQKTPLNTEKMFVSFANGGYSFFLAEDNHLLTDQVRKRIDSAMEAIRNGTLVVDWQGVVYE